MIRWSTNKFVFGTGRVKADITCWPLVMRDCLFQAANTQGASGLPVIPVPTHALAFQLLRKVTLPNVKAPKLKPRSVRKVGF